MTLKAGLYLVATPIGTANDITLRALDILRTADVIAAEDTRQARKLMDIHGVAVGGRSMVPYHDHNGPRQRPKLLARIADGASVAYVSDAGTPLIADPGYRLAQDAIAQDLPVFAAPGASAVLAALSVAGLPTDRFLFAGFSPVKDGARRSFFEEFAALRATLVFYESPRRLCATLGAMADVFGGERQAAVCRELTKKFEETRRATLQDLATQYVHETPKGEVVIVVGPPADTKPDVEDIDAALKTALETMSVRESVAFVSQNTGIARKTVYDRALALKRDAS